MSNVYSVYQYTIVHNKLYMSTCINLQYLYYKETGINARDSDYIKDTCMYLQTVQKKFMCINVHEIMILFLI